MAVFDIFQPQISVVSHDLQGKTILVYGDNGLGKTKNATKLPKPFYLPFERGINGIAGIPFLPISKWSDFVKINKQLTNPLTLSKTLEKYQTIIFDTVEASYMMCESFVCGKYDVDRIKDGNDGFGLWKEVATEYWKQINLLTNAGLTVYFIAHETVREMTDINGKTYDKKYPSGEKRAIDPICNLVDFVGYVKTNGVDENGNELPSSIYFKNSKEYKARSRFDYMTNYIEVFSAENLQIAIANAVSEQEKIDGVVTVSQETFAQSYGVIKMTLDELVTEIGVIAVKLNKLEKFDIYTGIVASHLGEGAKVKEASNKQTEQLELILNDLSELMETLNESEE